MTVASLTACLLLTGVIDPLPQPEPRDLKRLSVEQLMEIDVTLPTRQAEPVFTTAAAIAVITRDDIRRSGVTTIADALQLADGVHVARFNNASWSISARGLNGRTPNKLLVMIDGRIEFSPLFAGVFWNLVDYVLEDIERIEVIRGPGATLWGTNAVNGVVNIVTRHTRDTRGTYASLTTGNEDPLIAEVRQGGTLGDATWRIYGKVAQRDSQRFSTGVSADDSRRRGQAGLRLDRTSGADSWLVKADAFHSRDEFFDRRDGEATEMAVQGRWRRTFSRRARFDLRSYYRREYRNVDRQLTHHVDTIDVEAQHTASIARHQFVWGAGYRRNHDTTDGTPAVSFDPAERTYSLYHFYGQGEIAVVPDRLDVTAGLKVEINAFSGAEVQPNLRARLQLPRRQVLWGAVARAARRPTRFDDDISVGAPSGAVVVVGSNDFVAESLIATEGGYRVQPAAFFSADATLFVHRYDNLRSQEAPLTGVIPFVVGNTLRGQSHGVELAFNVQPVTRWRTHLAYTWLDTDISRSAGSRDVSGGVNEANDPHHLLGLRTAIDLRDDLELDARIRAVGALPNPVVPAYAELALRLGWSVTPRLALALVGEDLLHDRHPEFGANLPQRVEFERSVRAVLTVRLP